VVAAVKQVQVNGLTVITAPDGDAHREAATVIRQAALQLELNEAQLLAIEETAVRVQACLVCSCVVGHNVIRVVPADITQLVPDCEHELYAAGRCRTPRCPNYYLRSVA
jgi:hypothetical protein